MKTIFTIIFTISFSFAFSQSGLILRSYPSGLPLLSPGNSIVNNDTIVFCSEDLTSVFTEGSVKVINNSGDSMRVKVKRFGDQNICYASNQFCWTLCYSPSVSVAPEHITIQNNDSTSFFHGWVTPNGTEGCCFIKYRFFNMDDTTEFADVTIKYCFATNCSAPNIGLDEETLISANAYPNPTSDILTIELENLDVDAQLIISDVTGKQISQQLIPSGTTILPINVSNLTNGIYLYTIKSNNKILLTRKFTFKN